LQTDQPFARPRQLLFVDVGYGEKDTREGSEQVAFGRNGLQFGDSAFLNIPTLLRDARTSASEEPSIR
jgi:hypothetical protein